MLHGIDIFIKNVKIIILKTSALYRIRKMGYFSDSKYNYNIFFSVVIIKVQLLLKPKTKEYSSRGF